MHIDCLDWTETHPNRAPVFYKLEIILKCQTLDWKHLFKMVTADWSWCVVNVIHMIHRQGPNPIKHTLLFQALSHSRQSSISRSCFALTFLSTGFKNSGLEGKNVLKIQDNDRSILLSDIPQCLCCQNWFAQSAVGVWRISRNIDHLQQLPFTESRAMSRFRTPRRIIHYI